LAELNKYELLLNDLVKIETEVSILANKCKDLMASNKDLEEFAIKAKKEITSYSQKIINLESELESAKEKTEPGGVKLSNLLNTKETETLKVKLQNLISRIDYHLTADGQV